MRQFRPVLIAAALLALLTMPVLNFVGRQVGATVNTPGPDDGSWPGQFEQVYAIYLIGLVVTNVTGLGTAVFVARRRRPTVRGAMMLWAFAVAWVPIVNPVTSYPPRHCLGEITGRNWLGLVVCTPLRQIRSGQSRAETVIDIGGPKDLVDELGP